MDATKLRPLGDRALIRVAQSEDKSKGGIIIPDAAKKKPKRGTVLAIGEGRSARVRVGDLEDERRVPMDVKPGDEVLFGEYAGTPVGAEADGLFILDGSEVLGVIEPGLKDISEIAISAGDLASTG